MEYLTVYLNYFKINFARQSRFRLKYCCIFSIYCTLYVYILYISCGTFNEILGSHRTRLDAVIYLIFQLKEIRK